jgi:hypothetical protein
MAYSARYQHALGCSDKAFGGAGLNLGIEALGGDLDMVTVFDDFNDCLLQDAMDAATGDAATSHWEDNGWVLSDVSATAATIEMNDPNTTANAFTSCIKIFTGTADDAGLNAQLDILNADDASGASNLTSNYSRPFPHIWLPETDAGVALADYTSYVFACRVGMEGGASDGLWDGKYYIGLAAAGDTTILTTTTGEMDIATEAGPHVGFHCHEDGSIDGVSQRTATTTQAAGTNFTELVAAGDSDSTVANGLVTAGDIFWIDLAFRIDFADVSETTGNGWTTFYKRAVPPLRQASGVQRAGYVAPQNPPWVKHGTVLTDQTPNHSVAMVPTIEALNSPTGGEDMTLYVDWWTMGATRFSRLSEAAG